MKTYTPWRVQDSRIVVARDLIFRAPMKWEGRVKIECDLFGDEGPVYDIDGDPLHHGKPWGRAQEYIGVADMHIGKSRVKIHDLRRRVFSIIDNSQATFMAITKEPGRVRENWPKVGFPESGVPGTLGRFLDVPNLHLFAEAHNQATVDARVPDLLKCRDLSPSIGVWFKGLSEEVRLDRIRYPIDQYGGCHNRNALAGYGGWDRPRWEYKLDLVVIEGTDQPLNPNHVRSLISQCEAAGVRPVFLGWGDHIPFNQITNNEQRELWSKAVMAGKQSYFGYRTAVGPQGLKTSTTPGIEPVSYAEIGRESAGRMIDGREWGWE